MVVGDLDLVSVAVTPPKADAPLVVNANAVLPGTVPRQLLKPLARWNSQVAERFGCIEKDEFPQGNALEIGGPPPNDLAAEKLLGVAVGKAPDHPPNITPLAIIAKRY